MRCVRTFVAVALVAVGAGIFPAHAEGPAGAPAGAAPGIGGTWTGAKLRCQKEEGKLVRCGTPTSFEITFADDGTGSTPDDSLPNEFSWHWNTPKEIGMTPKAGGEEIKLFGVEREDENALTFQAYVFLPTADPNAPAEARYIHFVFDVNRAD
jgi:hypothetical protein